jgi:hypothetical protein
MAEEIYHQERAGGSVRIVCLPDPEEIGLEVNNL